MGPAVGSIIAVIMIIHMIKCDTRSFIFQTWAACTDIKDPVVKDIFAINDQDISDTTAMPPIIINRSLFNIFTRIGLNIFTLYQPGK